ncbi:MAG: hypothetical protein KF780_13685 [Sphingomonas sp.]|nr:hypothetical protein [Sphingomonas sp.]
MRRALPFLVLLLATTACGVAEPDSRSGIEPPNRTAAGGAPDAQDAAFTGGEASREAGPDIGTAAAPDVAFSYRYGFRLSADRIAAVQGQHQEICERLTLARCRITGMSYRADNERDVEAMLAFAVDPAAAGAFSREAVQRVTAADGAIAESRITGEDAGTPLRASQRGRAELEADLARIETRLRGLDPMAAEKGGLEAQAARLRAEIRALREAGDAQQAALATTPVLFRYGAGRYAPGPAPTPTLAETARDSGETALAGLLLLLRLIIIAAPWALAGLAGWWIVRRLRRHLPPLTNRPETDAA